MSDQIVEETTKKPTDVVRETLELAIDNVELSLATVRRTGKLAPIVFLCGFGSTKEDYLDIQLHRRFDDRAFIAYDPPGTGESTSSDYSRVSIPLLVSIAEHVVTHFLGDQKFYLLGHSMGGLTALLLADRLRDRVLGFINIKGNLAPEDCFLSRQIFLYPADDTETFVRQFIERARRSLFFGDALYAAGFRAKVHPDIVRPTFESMVQASDNTDLLSMFESLPCHKMYMFGEQFATLSYLDRISQAGIHLAEIPYAGHFVMYSNPLAMWDRIYDFLRTSA